MTMPLVRMGEPAFAIRGAHREAIRRIANHTLVESLIVHQPFCKLALAKMAVKPARN
jgi:hypothetical protein